MEVNGITITFLFPFSFEFDLIATECEYQSRTASTEQCDTMQISKQSLDVSQRNTNIEAMVSMWMDA